MDITVMFCQKNTFVLCKQGEYGNEFSFNYQPWLEEFGPGSVGWLIQRPNDPAAYPLVSTEENGISTIKLSETETQYAGKGMLEVYFINDGETEKRISNTASFFIEPTLQNTGDVPSPWQSYIDKINETAKLAQQSNILNSDFIVNSYAQVGDAMRVYTVFNSQINASAITGWSFDSSVPRLAVTYRIGFASPKVEKLLIYRLHSTDGSFTDEMRIDTPGITVTETTDTGHASYRGVLRLNSIANHPYVLRWYAIGKDADDNIVDQYYSSQIKFELVEGEIKSTLMPYWDAENTPHIVSTFLVEASDVGNLNLVTDEKLLPLVTNVMSSEDFHLHSWHTDIPLTNVASKAYATVQLYNDDPSMIRTRIMKCIIPTIEIA